MDLTNDPYEKRLEQIQVEIRARLRPEDYVDASQGTAKIYEMLGEYEVEPDLRSWGIEESKNPQKHHRFFAWLFFWRR